MKKWQSDPAFQDAFSAYMSGAYAMRRLVAVGLGTMAFGMQDVLLEPYGGEILHLTVGETTRLTAALAAGGLIGFSLASYVLSRGSDPFRMAAYGAMAGAAGFAIVIVSAPLMAPLLFAFGVALIGFGGGLFAHGTLTATMNFAPKHQTGLALGAWGAVQATAAGLGVALGGVIRDVVRGGVTGDTTAGAAAAYNTVYLIEIALLIVTIVAMIPLLRHASTLSTQNQPGPLGRVRQLDLQTHVQTHMEQS